jgi:hypothetical protein
VAEAITEELKPADQMAWGRADEQHCRFPFTRSNEIIIAKGLLFLILATFLPPSGGTEKYGKYEMCLRHIVVSLPG